MATLAIVKDDAPPAEAAARQLHDLGEVAPSEVLQPLGNRRRVTHRGLVGFSEGEVPSVTDDGTFV